MNRNRKTGFGLLSIYYKGNNRFCPLFRTGQVFRVVRIPAFVYRILPVEEIKKPAF
jgi:hypothetical protein